MIKLLQFLVASSATTSETRYEFLYIARLICTKECVQEQVCKICIKSKMQQYFLSEVHKIATAFEQQILSYRIVPLSLAYARLLVFVW
jgi:hypothetical protein